MNNKTECRADRHVWTVTNDGNRLDVKHLRAGHRCQCGQMEIYTRHCTCGGRHKRVGTLAEAHRHREPVEK